MSTNTIQASKPTSSVFLPKEKPELSNFSTQFLPFIERVKNMGVNPDVNPVAERAAKKLNAQQAANDNQDKQPNYRIAHGDTLIGIAKKHGTTVAALRSANPEIKNPDLIHAGRELKMPDGIQARQHGGVNRHDTTPRESNQDVGKSAREKSPEVEKAAEKIESLKDRANHLRGLIEAEAQTPLSLNDRRGRGTPEERALRQELQGVLDQIDEARLAGSRRQPILAASGD